MDAESLQVVWFFVIGLLLAGYAVLDGFDLGAGALSLLGRSPDERRLFLRAVGPVWDGNEVWLLAAGGALFAAFPAAYASAFSAFYLALVLAVLLLIGRAVSLEFRSLLEAEGYRRVFDCVFGISSGLLPILFGVAAGNLLKGLPLDPNGDSAGTFLGLLNPYALLVGGLSLSMLVCHGGLFMALKTDEPLSARMRRAALFAWGAWLLLLVAATAATAFALPHRMARPGPFLALGLVALALAVLPVLIRARRDLAALLCSGFGVAAMVALFGLSLFPSLVPATDPALDLTLARAASSVQTHVTMLIIAGLGMPLVLTYTVFIYRVFRGKVSLEGDGY